MRVVYFYREDWEAAYIRERLPQVEFEFLKGCLQDYPELKDDKAEGLVVFVKSVVQETADFDRFPALKFITTRSTGFDHINLKETQKRDITVMNVPEYGANTVAEHTFALLLALSRKIYDAYEQVREEGSFSQERLRGFDLAGKTLGVVGTGNIGKHVVKIAKGFGMQVCTFDVSPDDDFAQNVGFTYVSFDELLKQSDIVTLHVPYNKHTHHLLNKENIKKMKKGSYLINTSRGPVVETDALVQALKEEILAGAGLDVLEEEGDTMAEDDTVLLLDKHPSAETLKTVLENHYLIEHPRVIITPHIAFNTEEAFKRILDTTIGNIDSFIKGNPQNVVKK